MPDEVHELLVTDVAAEKLVESACGTAHLGVLGQPPAGHALVCAPLAGLPASLTCLATRTLNGLRFDINAR